MGWDGPILTDSGGYQVFSLAKTRRISEEGVEFASVYDGSRHVFTPELTTRVQEELGSDIAMVLDECPPPTRTRDYHEASLRRTARWARRCKEAHRSRIRRSSGSCREGCIPDLREESLGLTVDVGFDGYAVGVSPSGSPGRDARDAGAHRPQAARRKAEVLHGHRRPRRHPAGHSARGGYVRLRPPDAPRPPRRRPDRRRPHQPQEREAPPGTSGRSTPSAPARRAPATAGLTWRTWSGRTSCSVTGSSRCTTSASPWTCAGGRGGR